MDDWRDQIAILKYRIAEMREKLDSGHFSEMQPMQQDTIEEEKKVDTAIDADKEKRKQEMNALKLKLTGGKSK